MKLLRTFTDKCVQCGACMTACSKAFFKVDDPDCSRIQISNAAGLPRMNVCNQCGACIEVCPTKALERDKNGVVQVKKDLCTACLMCVGFCPTVSMKVEAKAQPQPFKCIACGICARSCPVSALEVQG